MQENAYIALISSLSLLGIAYLVFWKYKKFRVDSFRQEMFELRDNLFDEALQGLISFHHPAYGTLRSTMNGFIRFGHRMSLWQIIVFKLSRKQVPSKEISFDESWKNSTRNLNEETKLKLNVYRDRMERLVFKHTLLASPELYLPICLLFLVMLVVFIIEAIRDYKAQIKADKSRPKTLNSYFLCFRPLQTQMDCIDDAAYMFGKLA